MELNSLDEEQNNLPDAPLPAVSGIPPIIFVKEYINQSDSDNNDSTINSNVSKDERMSLNPSQLEARINETLVILYIVGIWLFDCVLAAKA